MTTAAQSPTSIRQIDNSDNAGLKYFVALERQLMKGQKPYISEIDGDVRKMLSGKTQATRNWEIGLFIVSKSGKDVGRCAAIINKKYQEQKQPGSGFIGYFAAEENCSTEITVMLNHAENWLKERGVTKIIAPANGGAPNTMGFLVAGFQEDPMFPFPWSPPYYPEYMDMAGYSPTYPMWYYDIDFSNEKYRNAKDKYAHYNGATIRNISKKNWNKDIAILCDVLNDAFSNEWEFAKMSHEESIEFFGPMKSILSPEQIQLAEVDGKVVGFCLGIPDLTPLFRSFKGKIGLLAILKLMTQGGKFKRAGILGIGVLKEYRGLGIAKAMAMRVYAYHEQLGLKSSLYYPVNQGNAESRAFAESIGGRGKLTYQVYDKLIATGTPSE